MKTRLYMKTLHFTLMFLLAHSASAEILIQIGVGDPDEVVFYASETMPGLNNSDYAADDGITLLNILSEDAEGGGPIIGISGDLTAAGVNTYGPYDSVTADSGWEGFPRSLNVYWQESMNPAESQEFDTDVQAFSGVGTLAPGFKDNFSLRKVGATGDIVAGYQAGNVSPVIGQWAIVSGALPSGRIILEEPVDGAVHGGIGNLRGYAFFQLGVEKVEIYIDGEYAFDAPYGGSRTDVADAFPEWEALNSGFSLAYGYSNLAPGEHTITARAIDPDGFFDEDTSTFTVVAFKEQFIFSDQPVDGSAADVAMDGDEIEIRSIQVGDDSYDLKLKWRTAEQGFEIIEID